jgi:hypothetical protein
MLVFTLSVVLLTLSVALLTLSVAYVVAKGCADMRVPAIVVVVGILSPVVDGFIQEQPAIFCPVGDLLNFVILSCLV